MKKLILLLTILPYIFTACVEEDNLPQYLGEFKLGAEGEAYIKFEPSSYWIYENTKTKETERIELTNYISKTSRFIGNHYSFDKEMTTIYWLKNNTAQLFFSPWDPYPDATRNVDFNANTDVFSHTMYGQKSGSCIFFYPFRTEYGGCVSGQRTTINKIYDSLQVQGKWHYKVAEFELDNDWSWNTLQTNHTKYYWAKNVGLVRRVLLEEHTTTEVESWNLIDYNLTP